MGKDQTPSPTESGLDPTQGTGVYLKAGKYMEPKPNKRRGNFCVRGNGLMGEAGTLTPFE